VYLPTRLLAWLRPLAGPAFACALAVITALSVFLRLYGVRATEFDADQATLFRLASDAVHHGLLPVTASAASIGVAMPPGPEYLFMIVAAFTGNPVGVAALVAVLAALGAPMTCWFASRYFGRLVAFIAGTLYAVSWQAVIEGTFIWQPNIMGPFVILFMMLLFCGAVEGRRWWLAGALPLLGFLYGMHEVTLLLIVPLAAAVIMARRSVRLADAAVGLAGLLLVSWPFAAWECLNGLRDVRGVMGSGGGGSSLNGGALGYYARFLVPYDQNLVSPGTYEHSLVPYLEGTGIFALGPMLAACGIVGLVIVLVQLRLAPSGTGVNVFDALLVQRPRQEPRAIPAAAAGRVRLTSGQSARSLVLLVLWQGTPLAVFSLQSTARLQWQYFDVLLPGPYLLVGLLAVHMRWWWARASRHATAAVLGALYCVTAGCLLLLVASQTIGGVAFVRDRAAGRGLQAHSTDLSSLYSAVRAAGAAAHVEGGGVYLASNSATRDGLDIVAQDLGVQSTTFADASCVVLPGPGEPRGAVLLGPSDWLPRDLLHQYGAASRTVQIPKLVGDSYTLWIGNARRDLATLATPLMFDEGLELLGTNWARLPGGRAPVLVISWQFLQGRPAGFESLYNYSLSVTVSGFQAPLRATCSLDLVHRGDVMMLVVPAPPALHGLHQLALRISTSTTIPYDPWFGPIHCETYESQTLPGHIVRTRGGALTAIVQVRAG